MSRDERPETDPIDFNLLAAMDSRGLASQPFPAFGTNNTQVKPGPECVDTDAESLQPGKQLWYAGLS